MLADLRIQLHSAIEKSLKEFSSENNLPEIILESPADKKYGELSSTIAMRLAKILKKDPVSLAGDLCAFIERNIKADSNLKEKINRLEVKGPGFINFFLNQSAFYDILYDVFKKDKNYGRKI
jgi:arginyl-tRNA synthetase